LKAAYFILNSFDVDTRARLEVETLREIGLEVEIIATTGGTLNEFRGAKIHRVPQWRDPTRKFRFAQYNFLAAAIGAKIKADIYHAVDLDTLLAASLAARRRRAPIIYEARELYAELEALVGRKAVKAAWTSLERRLIHRAARVVTINDSIAGELIQRYGIEKPVVIRNVAILPSKIEPIDLRAAYAIPRDWKVLVYQGVLRRGQGLSYALEIMRHLEKMVLIFIGDGVIKPELIEKAAALGLSERVRFAGRIDSDRLPDYTAGADVGLLLMEDVALNNRLALPQKIFQYVAAEVPQVVSPMTEIAAFVNREKTGLVVTLSDAEIAALDISTFLSDEAALADVKSRCRESAARNNWELESKKWLDVYQELIS
jgi:glycosyltransferase involved in cell wall biosynthesis